MTAKRLEQVHHRRLNISTEMMMKVFLETIVAVKQWHEWQRSRTISKLN